MTTTVAKNGAKTEKQTARVIAHSPSQYATQTHTSHRARYVTSRDVTKRNEYATYSGSAKPCVCLSCLQHTREENKIRLFYSERKHDVFFGLQNTHKNATERAAVEFYMAGRRRQLSVSESALITNTVQAHQKGATSTVYTLRSG